MSTSDSPPSSPSSPSIYAIAFSSALLGLLSGYFLSTALSLNLFTSPSPSSSNARDSNPHQKKKKKKPPQKSWPNSYDVTLHPDTSDEELMKSLKAQDQDQEQHPTIPSASSAREALDAQTPTPSSSESEAAAEQASSLSQTLSTFPSHPSSTYKMVLVIRPDLNLSAGKTAAQASHATLSNYRLLSHPPPSPSRRKFFSPTNPSPTWDPTPNPVLGRWEAQGQAKIVVSLSKKEKDGGGEGEEGLLRVQREARRRGLCAEVVRDAGRTEVRSGTATCVAVGPGPREVVDEVTGGFRLL